MDSVVKILKTATIVQDDKENIEIFYPTSRIEKQQVHDRTCLNILPNL